MSSKTEQVRSSSANFIDTSLQANVACCPECSSLTISRVKRSFFQKITSRKLRFYCHDCRIHFWRE